MHVNYVHQFDKDIWFSVLVPLSNRTKEEWYRALYVLMIHYNKAVFSIKCIECDGGFKSIMDEVSDDMVIEMNCVNPEDHVSEAERNNRMIKEMFQISYYRFPYKNIPIIVIVNLAMNVAQILNLFPAKVVVLDQYIPHMIISHMN